MNSMLSPLDAPQDAGPIRLLAHNSTVAAEDLRVRLVLAADFQGRIEVDASEVESVGQAVLQLLIAARIDAEQNGMPFEILNPSRAFVERVTACCLADAIGLATEKDVFQ
ncbi:STAS domain-containing protein [Sphingomonas mucosissima]|uniref:MlaB-like STAS domain-containing protein n=1 Tax=Sphingomonas mucosissima TaxID=370959 RepID=A0A245ZTP1_9SPHN|nr:STAS domain-containing protein [Sphingomonas mucosissima]OWK33101.1 hypothetical protein SPMU_14470 [Sphingomonas mucosissima]